MLIHEKCHIIRRRGLHGRSSIDLLLGLGCMRNMDGTGSGPLGAGLLLLCDFGAMLMLVYLCTSGTITGSCMPADNERPESLATLHLSLVLVVSPRRIFQPAPHDSQACPTDEREPRAKRWWPLPFDKSMLAFRVSGFALGMQSKCSSGLPAQVHSTAAAVGGTNNLRILP